MKYKDAGYKKAKLLSSEACRVQKGKISSEKSQLLYCMLVAIPAAMFAVRSVLNFVIKLQFKSAVRLRLKLVLGKKF